MSKKIIDGIWIIVCDWVDPQTGKTCDLGKDEDGMPDGSPLMAVDPDNGRSPEKHFQCGRHHGIIPQAEQEEYQLPEGHKLYEDQIVRGSGRE